MPPNDPLFLSISDEEILFEYETFLAASGEPLKECPKCKTKTHQRFCPTCAEKGEAMALTGDALADDLQARMEAGEKIDFDAIFNKDSYEPVTPEGDAQ